MNIKANQYIKEVTPKYSKPKNKKQITILHPEDVYKLFNDIVDDALEKFIGIFLDSQSRVNCFQIFTIGSLDAAHIYTDEIVRTALITGSDRIILLHNHPSGALKPSKEDLALTRKVKEVLKMFNIKLMEHLIIAGDGYYSFREHELIDEDKDL